MTDEELVKMLNDSNPNELWIINSEGKLEVLFCPFRVKAKNNVGDLKQNQIVWVDEVKVTRELIKVYIIKGKAYFYYHFDIIG